MSKPDWAKDAPQIKPNWINAPEWAQFLAQDWDGNWFWYAKKPQQGNVCWLAENFESQCAGYVNEFWKETLEERPNNEQT